MKLSDILRFGFTATVVLALILLPSCSATGPDSGPSSSASGQEPSPSPPPANKYYKLLDVKRIAAKRGDKQSDHFNRYSDVPFYGKGPIFDTETNPSVVEQALQDYGLVGIVDPIKKVAVRIQYEEGLLKQKLFADQMAPIRLIDLDYKLHRLRKKIQGLQIDFPPEEPARYLPRANNRPILMSNSNSLGQMLYAVRDGSGKFYHVQPGKEPILVDPKTETLYTTPVDGEKQEIQRVLKGYGAAQQKYGTNVASFIWGHPIPAQTFQSTRMARTSLKEYPRFTLQSRGSAMREALQNRGRFRLYTGNQVAYKVKVKNPEARGSEALQVYVEPLSKIEQAQERFLAFTGKIHLPM
ncbi:hypothetical protein NDA16_000089 [Ustilago loliicola]|nr:hypothetical protein NDA16_000089 [Ustilago loliicola]